MAPPSGGTRVLVRIKHKPQTTRNRARNLTGVKTRPNKNRTTAYECGLPSEVQKGFRFGISFYLIAMLFILFDIEVIFIYPIALELRAFGPFALGETITFVVLLTVAFIYVWRRGALEWK